MIEIAALMLSGRRHNLSLVEREQLNIFEVYKIGERPNPGPYYLAASPPSQP